ncbi:MAG: hypothetical protein Q4D65_09150 [Peptostreptococcaceae bacterium]|nr:hypothetical protein [Peptostreptococcaceae bacterium]
MARKKKDETLEEMIPEEAVFTRDEILKSKRFENERDILNILLMSGERYTLSQAKTMIENWKKEEEQC